MIAAASLPWMRPASSERMTNKNHSSRTSRSKRIPAGHAKRDEEIVVDLRLLAFDAGAIIHIDPAIGEVCAMPSA